MIGRIDCKWWGLWEASGTYPSKINPRTPHPHRGSLSHPAFELSTSQAQFPHKDKSSVSKSPRSPSQQKTACRADILRNRSIGCLCWVFNLFQTGPSKNAATPEPSPRRETVFLLRGKGAVYWLHFRNMAEPQRKSSKCQMKHVFSGTLVHSTKENMMEICKKRLIGVDSNGKVTVSLFCLEFCVS